MTPTWHPQMDTSSGVFPYATSCEGVKILAAAPGSLGQPGAETSLGGVVILAVHARGGHITHDTARYGVFLR